MQNSLSKDPEQGPVGKTMESVQRAVLCDES